jgi:hypothetical protein
MKAADDQTVVGLVEEREGKTLIAARVFEWAEADQPLAGVVMAAGTLENGHSGRQFIEVLAHFVNDLEVLAENGLQVTLSTTREHIYPLFHPADL